MTTTAPLLTLDCTQLSVVVLCRACPWWHGFAFDRLDGWAVADRHERAVHPESTQAASNLDKARKRAQIDAQA